MPRSLRALQLAGGAAMVATMGLLTLIAHARQPAAAASELLVRVPRSPQLWLGENWYIDGLEDDGQYMVPSTPADESSGNSLFDFGSAHGTPLSKSTGEPVPGHLPLDYWKRTGTSEKHFPNEIYQFDIEGIRRLEDGIIPYWERKAYYDDTYPKYRKDMGFIEGPQVMVKDGHVEDIEDNGLHFFNNNEPNPNGY